MIQISLRPGTPALPGECCEVLVQLHNTGGATTVANPAALLNEPRWQVTGPDGRTRVVDNGQNFVAPADQPARLALAAGAQWQASVALRLPMLADGPGEHRVSLLLDTEQGRVDSAPCTVQVAGWDVRAADAAHGRSVIGGAEGDSLWLAAGMLYRMGWREDDSDRQGQGHDLRLPLCAAGPSATDLRVPQRDAPFWQDPARWLLWREGATVHAVDTSLQQRSLTLGAEPAALLRPALQREGGPVQVFALSTHRRRLELLQFPRGAEGDAVVAGHIDLGRPVAEASAAFGAGESLAVALTADTADGCELLLHHGGTLQAAMLDGHRLLPRSAPALRLSDDGRMLVAALVQAQADVLLAQVHFDASGAGAVALSPLGHVEDPIDEGAVLLTSGHGHGHGDHNDHDHGGGVHVLLRLADGRLLRLGSSGQLEDAAFAVPPVRPLAMLPGGHGALVLACDPRIGPLVSEA